MSLSVVRATSMRRSETPNAVMTTLASPTQGGTKSVSAWRIVMHPGQQGPRHVFDREQVWHVLSGDADFTVEGETAHLHAGDAVVLPGGAERQVTAVTTTEIIACGESAVVATVVGEDHARGTPSWIG
jgi:quercetin dioxygenase-like cupin family protein